MNELKIFENEEFGTIREITIDDEPWFVGKDVAEALVIQIQEKLFKTMYKKMTGG